MTYQNDPNYLNATDQERKWFDLFYQDKDMLAATKGAYRVNGDDSARAYGKSVLARKHIAELIRTYCTQQPSLPSAEELKFMYLDIARDGNATPRDKLAALVAYERLAGFTVKGKPIATPTDDPFAGIDD
jgi:hypothetical protein